MATLIGPTHAAALLGRSREIIIYWAKSGRLRPARTRPLKFRLADVVAFTPPPPRPGTGRPRGMPNIIKEVTG